MCMPFVFALVLLLVTRALLAAPSATRQRPNTTASSGRAPSRTSPNESWEASGDLGDLAPQPAAPRPLK
jgi:hypothetical protein